MPEPEQLLLLGKDFGEYGTFASTAVGSRGAAAISVGSDQNSPSNRFKDNPLVKNEDALCFIETDRWSGFAVADAHYGPEASHLFIDRLHNAWAAETPTDASHLDRMAIALCDGGASASYGDTTRATTGSETTLLIVVFDHTTNEGFGLSVGDSSFVIVGPDSPPEVKNPRNMWFTQPAAPHSMMQSQRFSFSAKPGDVLLTFTDGIDECHYRSPETSVQLRHIADIAANADFDPPTIVDELTSLALLGVGDNPGGQDNIALIASRVS